MLTLLTKAKRLKKIIKLSGGDLIKHVISSKEDFSERLINHNNVSSKVQP